MWKHRCHVVHLAAGDPVLSLTHFFISEINHTSPEERVAIEMDINFSDAMDFGDEEMRERENSIARNKMHHMTAVHAWASERAIADAGISHYCAGVEVG